MARRDPAEVHAQLPDWQRRMTSYLGLGPNPPPPRPTWLRVLSAVAAVIMAVGVVFALVDGRWLQALLRFGLMVLALSNTRREVATGPWARRST
jgi:hypothetical protein